MLHVQHINRKILIHVTFKRTLPGKTKQIFCQSSNISNSMGHVATTYPPSPNKTKQDRKEEGSLKNIYKKSI